MTRITRINREKFEAPKEGEPGPKCHIVEFKIDHNAMKGPEVTLTLKCFDPEDMKKIQELAYRNKGEVILESVSKAPKPKKERTKERFKSDKTKMRTRNGDTVELNDRGEIEEYSVIDPIDTESILKRIGAFQPEIDPLADLKTKIRTFDLK